MRHHLYFAAFLTTSIVPVALGASVQAPFINLPPDAHMHQQAVVNMLLDSYQAYKKFAFPHDDLTPISKSFFDGRNGWGATIVDAMTTFAVMGQEELFLEAVNFSSKIDFSVSHTSDSVSIFETTIRYLAGLISAYELSGKIYPILIDKAKEVANKMVAAWEASPSPIPWMNIDFNTSIPILENSVISQAGTLTLEWSRLAKYTGNDTYRQLAEDTVRHIAQLPAPLPGLAAQGLDPKTGNFVGGLVSWGSGSDSYFEYLIKYARITNTDDNLFADTWATAVDSTFKELVVRSTVGNHLYVTDRLEDGTLRHVGSHLGCFTAGNWMLGGRLLNNQTIVDKGLELNDACWNTYASTTTGIGPEIFGYFSEDGNFTGATPTAEDLAFYDKHGFFIYPQAEYYYLRPEVLESNFYAWRVTGNRTYLDRAASAIDSFNKFTKAPIAFAGIWNVDKVDSGFIDDTESFWYGEVLKYLYLTFDDPGHISLDEWVINTECHPFKAPPAKDVYGSGNLIDSSTFGPFRPESGSLPAVSPAAKLPPRP
ncbi:hypothetical protein QCA50_015557 [Cerrena zonata]|uniref:alpha-1,2-Mannosidase n=1 Tax=Cerrena zonata TaxID=2478898 RepID=A0AAW0FJ45_9APHY